MTSTDILEIDARGHRCPVPTLRLQKALDGVRPGFRVRLLADDPMARIDVPHFLAGKACRLVETSSEGSTLSFLIETLSAPDAREAP